MRIAIDTRAYFQRTGIARYTRGLVAGLAARARDHEILLLISDHHRPDEIPLPDHMIAQVSSAPWLGGDEERQMLESEVQAWDADVFHAIFPPIAFDTLPSIVTIFDLTPLTHPQLHQEVVRTAFERAWIQMQTTGARLVAISQATRDAIALVTGDAADAAADVIGVGLSPPFDQLPDTADPNTRRGVLFVGTLEPRKNAPLVLDAISLLAQRGIVVPLTIVGKVGWGDQQWRESLPANVQVRCTGYVSDAELLALYREAAVLVYPSAVEGFGLPVLEAMAQGVVPIVSKTPALAELVADPRFTVDTTPMAIAEAITAWLSDASARGAAARDLQTRAQTYRWPLIADAWLACYAEVAKTGSSRSSRPTSRIVSSTK